MQSLWWGLGCLGRWGETASWGGSRGNEGDSSWWGTESLWWGLGWLGWWKYTAAWGKRRGHHALHAVGEHDEGIGLSKRWHAWGDTRGGHAW